MIHLIGSYLFILFYWIWLGYSYGHLKKSSNPQEDKELKSQSNKKW